MSYLGEIFDHDIFISYSHGDVDGAGSSLLKQWTQGLVVQLEKELKAFPDLGANIKVFLDQHHRPDQGLDPNAPLTETLKQKIGASGLLAVIMCPQYLRSDWCRRERDWWFSQARDRGFDPMGRLAVARIWPAEDKGWPRELCDTGGNPIMGTCFFNRERAEDFPQPFGWPMVDDGTIGEFRDALLDFVTSIRRTLLRNRQAAEEQQKRAEAAGRLAAADGQLLYLHARQEQEGSWEKVVERLSEAGFSVFPLTPERVDAGLRAAERARADRIDTMSGCDALLILGIDNSPSLSSDIATIGRLDRQRAIARSSRPLPCGVLDTSGLRQKRPAWPRQVGQLGIEWLDAADAEIGPRVRRWLNGVVA